MKLILERNLDFKQFQNLIILTFVTIMILLGMLNSAQFKTHVFLEFILIFLNVLFITILFTKKGLCVKDRKLYVAVFLFGSIIKKSFVNTSHFQEVTL